MVPTILRILLNEQLIENRTISWRCAPMTSRATAHPIVSSIYRVYSIQVWLKFEIGLIICGHLVFSILNICTSTYCIKCCLYVLSVIATNETLKIPHMGNTHTLKYLTIGLYSAIHVICPTFYIRSPEHLDENKFKID